MKAVILCYHKVGPQSEEGRWLNIEPLQLARHVQLFTRRNFEFVTATQLKSKEWGKWVAFTFDDAYTSAVSNAPALLEDVGGRGTFFAVPSLVGQSSSWDGELARPLAGWKALRELQASGHEIGNHTNTHPRLDSLSLTGQILEISEAQRRLLQEGIETESVCFPYGNFNKETLSVIRECGMSVGLMLGKRVASSVDNRLCLPRVIVAYSDGVVKLLYKIYIRPLLRSRG